MKIEIKPINKKTVWEKFVLSKRPKSFLQSWNWGETQKIVGKKIFRLGIFANGKLVGCSLVIKESAKRGSYLVIPGGPLLDWDGKDVVSSFLNYIKKLADDEGVWFIRIRPEVIDGENARNKFRKLGFISAPMHLHAENTWVLDLQKSEEELFKGMRKTTRYLVKKSMNAGLSLKVTTDPEDSKILKELQDETVERHKFVGFSENLFKAQLETFAKDRQGAMFMVKKGSKILASAIIIFYGDFAYYHHSGSVSGFREIPFSYFLQWKIICESIKRGIRYYNFWGIAPNDDFRHRFHGVTVFKTGFGGERIDWLHAQDIPISKLYYITYIFETLRRNLRKL